LQGSRQIDEEAGGEEPLSDIEVKNGLLRLQLVAIPDALQEHVHRIDIEREAWRQQQQLRRQRLDDVLADLSADRGASSARVDASSR
jgi:hypothetical protein